MGRETSDIDYFALCLKEMYYGTEFKCFWVLVLF